MNHFHDITIDEYTRRVMEACPEIEEYACPLCASDAIVKGYIAALDYGVVAAYINVGIADYKEQLLSESKGAEHVTVH